MTAAAGPRADLDAPRTLPASAVALTGHWSTRLTRRQAALLMTSQFVVAMAIWQLLVGELGLVNPLFLPDPLRIANGFVQLAGSGELWLNLRMSAFAYFAGFGIAAVVGISLGLLLGASVPVNRLAGPVLWSLYATPWLAYRPVSVVWFGFGSVTIIFLAFMASVFPILFNTAAGASATNRSLLQAGKVFGAGRLRTYLRIILPSTLPYVIAGLRQSAVMAMIGMLVAEMTGSPVGIGALISLKTNTYRTDQAFVAIIIAIVWTVLMGWVLDVLGRRLAPWVGDGRQ